jgi:signal transduction histidine kinase
VYQKAIENGYFHRKYTTDPASAGLKRDESLSDWESRYFDEMTRLNNELTNLQRDYAKKNLELEKLNKLKNQFLGMAAHDIRNSLWVIQLSSRLLIQETDHLLNEEQLDALDTIFKSSKSVQKVVDKFLSLVNITEGKIELNYQHLDIMLLISHCTKLNKALAEKRKVTFAVSPTNREIEAWIDPSAMEQVLNNLLSNAIKYSPKGSVVQIHVKVEKDDIQLSVKNKGEGIPPEKQKNIFKPFVRDSQQRLKDQKSFGLGLAIVKKIVEAHNGRVWIKSRKNQGATFFISLPKS